MGLFVEGAGEVEQRLDVLAFGGCDETNGGVVETGHHFVDVFVVLFGGGAVFGEVPFVDDYDAGFVEIENGAGDFFVDLGDFGDSVDQEQYDVGTANRTEGAGVTVVFDTGGDHFALFCGRRRCRWR